MKHGGGLAPGLRLLLLVFMLSGCAQPSVLLRDKSPKSGPGPVKVLLMPPDVELSELTAGGLLEPKAEWTERAREHIQGALSRELAARKATLVSYREPEGEAERAADTQILKLHDVVGGAILVHKFVPVLKLPTKDEKFDWSLGSEVGRLRTRTEADYALFVVFRDSYASSGRVAVMVGAALLGVGVPGGRQVGFASLVDLRSGDLLWFNRLFDPSGDLRTPEPAGRAVKALLTDLPL